jgi:chromosome segregation ATPase
MASGGSQRDQERKLTELDRQNFDLKMQIYYLNQKLSETQGGHDGLPPATDGPIDSGRVSDRRGRTPVANNGHHSQAPIMKSSSHAASATAANISTAVKEDATKMIARNDTLVINKLEKEMAELKKEHLRDAALINEYEVKLAQNMRATDDLNSRLQQERGVNVRLQQKISLLLDRMQRYELALKRRNITLPEDSAASVHEYISSHLVPYEAEKTMAPISESATPVFETQLALSDSKGRRIAPQHFLDFGSRTAWGELHMLRRQVKDMKQQQRSERELFKAQEDALRLLQQSVAEVGRLESAEVKRMEGELEKSAETCERWKQRCRQLETICAEANIKQDGFAADIDDWDEEGHGELRTSAAVVNRVDTKAKGTVSMAEHQKIVEFYRYDS